jgi:hypothetical protein
MCVLFATIESHVIRTDRVEVPPQGLVLKIVIKPDREGKMKVQVKTVDKGKRFGAGGRHTKVEDVLATTEHKGIDIYNNIPSIENRFGIAVGKCPEGYISKGGFCFPDYDA